MIRFRPFLNRDPPALAEIWRGHVAPRAIYQPMSAALLDLHVLAKPYFDKNDLIVAEDGGSIQGFVHVAILSSLGESHSPLTDGSSAEGSPADGVVCMLLVRPDLWRTELAGELLAQGERRLQALGARTIHGYGGPLLNPFYLGLYGGSESRGVLDSDAEVQRALAAAGYALTDRFVILHRDLASFRAPVNRSQLQARRVTTVQVDRDPAAANWRQACALSPFDRWRFDLVPRDAGSVCGTVAFWVMEPLCQRWGVRAVGLVGLAVDSTRRRQGLATCLVSDAFRQLQAEGFTVVEAQAALTDTASLQMFRGLGFAEVEQGSTYRKQV